MATPTQLARAMHTVVEPIHAIAYFATEFTEAWEALGLEPVAQGYVAGRAAPLGQVGAEAVAATFFNFNPAMIRMGVPGAWSVVSPAQVLGARAQAAQDCFTRLEVPTDHVDEATELAQRATEDLFTGGRPLAAANAAVPMAGLPLGDLWQALAVLREHRGDGHVALLVSAGLSPVEALVLYSGWQGRVSRRFLQATRVWDDEAWDGAIASLGARGLADDEGLTDEGVAFRQELEDRTDQAAAAPWARLGEDDTRRLWELLHPMATAVAAGYPRPPSLPDAFPV